MPEYLHLVTEVRRQRRLLVAQQPRLRCPSGAHVRLPYRRVRRIQQADERLQLSKTRNQWLIAAITTQAYMVLDDLVGAILAEEPEPCQP